MASKYEAFDRSRIRLLPLAQRTHDVDLIAMCTRRRSAVSRWVFGSVVEKVLHDTSLPLLLVRDTIGKACDHSPES